jgi:hypothetical protein
MCNTTVFNACSLAFITASGDTVVIVLAFHAIRALEFAFYYDTLVGHINTSLAAWWWHGWLDGLTSVVSQVVRAPGAGETAWTALINRHALALGVHLVSSICILWALSLSFLIRTVEEKHSKINY